jgi:hypothetical protein
VVDDLDRAGSSDPPPAGYSQHKTSASSLRTHRLVAGMSLARSATMR